MQNLTKLLGHILENENKRTSSDRPQIIVSLPTWGPCPVNNTEGIWSWEGDYVLVGSCVSELRIAHAPTDLSIVRVGSDGGKLFLINY